MDVPLTWNAGRGPASVDSHPAVASCMASAITRIVCGPLSGTGIVWVYMPCGDVVSVHGYPPLRVHTGSVEGAAGGTGTGAAGTGTAGTTSTFVFAITATSGVGTVGLPHAMARTAMPDRHTDSRTGRTVFIV